MLKIKGIMNSHNSTGIQFSQLKNIKKKLCPHRVFTVRMGFAMRPFSGRAIMEAGW